MALGQIIRKRREKKGLTLDEVSRRTGYSKPYLSTIETGRVKNPPADELLHKLEQILDFDDGILLHIAHMEKLPADIREAFEKNQAETEHWRSLFQKLIDHKGSSELDLQSDEILEALRESGSSFDHILTAGRLIPVINSVTAGYPMDYDDKGYPPGWSGGSST